MKEKVNNTLLTKRKASKILGCSHSLINTYIEKGYLDEVQLSGGQSYISKSSLDAFMCNFQDNVDYHQKIKDRIELEYNQEIAKLKSKIDAAIAKQDYITFVTSGRMKLAIESIIDILPSVRERDREILHMIANGKSISEISKATDCSSSSVRFVVARNSIKISSLANDIEILVLENTRLKRKCEMQNAHINSLRREIQEIKRSKEKPKKEPSLYSRLNTYSISGIGLSGRPLWALTRGGVNTVADLLTYSSAELLAFRNMGKISVSEIETCVGEVAKQFGEDLCLGMFPKYYSQKK